MIMDVDELGDENSKKIVEVLAPNVSTEPLLGSITTNPLAKDEKGMQIRSSARVFKKMKLEQELDKKPEDFNHPENTITSPNADHLVPLVGCVDKNTEQEAKGHPVRSSTRVVKKVKQELPVLEIKSKKDDPKPDIKKEARKWNYGDKMMFFEAVNEFGKDFENIQQYINSKLKKKGASEEQLRTKEHVRKFYIRTFHEVAKHVKFSDSVKKVVQELYGIINYGELYKKLGVVTEKACMKLSELIYRGETCIRVKGKNNRIKTPMCRALVKLNQLDEKYQEVKLPNRVTVELRPKDMTSYLKIQCLAQNPRLRTTLPIQKRLSALIQCLDKRWRTIDILNYEKSIVSNNPITNDCIPSKQDINEKIKLMTPALRLSPPPDAKIELPSINISEYLTRQTICLTAYESRLGLDTFSEIKEMMSKKKKPKLDVEAKAEFCDNIKSEQIKSEETEVKYKLEVGHDRLTLTSEIKEMMSKKKKPKLEVETKAEYCDNIKMEQIKSEENEPNNYNEAEPDASLADAVHDAVNTILSLQTFERQNSETSETEELPIKLDNIKQETPKTEMLQINEEDMENIEKIKKGWTKATSESLTIGEIYLMYGSDSKLLLEYSWGDAIEEPGKPKKAAANFLEIWNDNYEESWEIKKRNLTSSLSKLLSLAKLHYRQNNVKCACGHICSEKTMKNTGSAGNSKVRKSTLVGRNNTLTTSNHEGNMLIADSSCIPNGKSQGTSGLFRTPLHILPKGPNFQTSTMQQQLNSIQRLKPKFCNRKGRRLRQKPIVVERKLPLLPNDLSGHQIVRMSIISQEPPVAPNESKIEAVDAVTDSVNTDSPKEELNLEKVIEDPEEDNSVISTVASSPSRILKEGESEWINADVADYSLSSLLGHLESPVKNPVSLNSNMAADLSSEVDAQLQSLMTENSMDFAASFADLAASVASDRKF